MRRRVACALAVAWISACGPSDDGAPAPAPTPAAPHQPEETPAEPTAPVAPLAPAPAPAADASAAAAEVFATRCAVCHGAEGRGDGPGGAALDPKPRNFHERAWQSAASDDGIRRAILEGGAALGKSAAMVAHPDLAARPEVLAALVARIRGFGAP